MIKKLILVFKTHVDIGFTDLAKRVIESYQGKLLEDVIQTCHETRHMGSQKYIWTLPAWVLKQMTEGDSVAAKKACELVENGQLRWHALAFTSHFDFCGIEDYVRSLRYSKELADRFQIPGPITAKMTDVPGHGYFLPTILHHMGIQFLHLGSNEFPIPLDIPELFHWEGPDGSKTLTMYSKSAYGTTLEAPKDWGFPVWMALMQTNDNSGPQSKIHLDKIIAKAKWLYPDAEIVTGTMDDFYKELCKYDLLQVPVIRGDMGDTWIHGVGTYPKEVSKIRELRNRLTRVEKALSILEIAGEVFPEDNIQREITKAYDHLILFGEHTWGLDVKTHMGGQHFYEKDEFLEWKKSSFYSKMKESWREQSQRVEEAEHTIEKIEQLLQKSDFGKGEDHRISVFNPSGRIQSCYVEVEPYRELLKDSVFEKDSILYQAEEIGGKLMVYLKNLPPLSFSAFSIVKKQSMETSKITTGLLIQNHRYRIRVGEQNGRILEIFDKKLNKNLVDVKDEECFGGYRYDRYSDHDINEFIRDYGYRFSGWAILDNGKPDYPITPHDTCRPVFKEVISTHNSLSLVFETKDSAEKFGDCKKIVTQFTLPAHTDQIDITVQIHEKQESLYAESGYITFPFSFQEETVLLNKTGCMVDISKDIVTNANHVDYCIENSVTIHDDQSAVTIVSHDSPLVSIGEIGMFKFRPKYESHRPTVFFNTYNNMWGTNFPQWIGGDFTFRFTIISHEKTDIPHQFYQGMDLIEGGVSLSHFIPPIAPLWDLPENLRPISLSPYKDGYHLRLRECFGLEKDISIQLSEKLTTVRLEDLCEHTLVEGIKNRLSFQTKPYGLYTIFFRN